MRTATASVALAWCLVVNLFAGCGAGIDEPIESSSSALNSPLTLAVKVGEPFKGTAGGALTAAACYARSIWDMQRFEGRIHIGAGDRVLNTGGTVVWSLGHATGTPDLLPEIALQEEIVQRFHDYGDRLYIPGADSTESWALGNFYFKDHAGWVKRRTVPNGVHVEDIAVLDGQTLAYATDDQRKGHLFLSDDDGLSWTELRTKAVGLMVAMQDRVLIFGAGKRRGLSVYQDGKLSKRSVNIYPHLKSAPTKPARLVRFGDHVLYVAEELSTLAHAPLLALGPADRAPLVQYFGDQGVRDIVVDGDEVHVLTARPDGQGQYLAAVYSSTDLASWTPRASFVVPAPPHSFERLDGTYYVGLGSEGWILSDTTPEIEAGSIWRLQ